MPPLPEALYRAADARTADARAVEQYHVAGARLMGRAGQAAFELLRQRWPRARRIALVCGPGNNGGDGFVIADLLRDAGLTPVVMVADPAAVWRGDAGDARIALERDGIVAHPFAAAALSDCELIVDALFGTGLTRPLEEPWRGMIEAINASDLPVLAIDLPSGLHADTGRVLGAAVRASATISFIALKAGSFTGRGRAHAGEIAFHDLRLPAGVLDGLTPLARRITPANLSGLLAPRARDAHKGSVGRVLVVAGAAGMPGAARLTGEAAYRSGAGLVTVVTDPAHAAQIAAARPELIAQGAASSAGLDEPLARAHAVVIGPGLGHGDWGRSLFGRTLEARAPLTLDADALNLLAREPVRRDDWVLTPHAGEAARLLGCGVDEVETDRFGAARAIVERYGGVCVLKGPGSLIAGPAAEPLWLCDAGNPGLATGGSGDVLAGAIGALLAQGLAPVDAARVAVWCHARAGDRLAAVHGERGLLAGDLPPALRAELNALVTVCV